MSYYCLEREECVDWIGLDWIGGVSYGHSDVKYIGLRFGNRAVERVELLGSHCVMRVFKRVLYIGFVS